MEIFLTLERGERAGDPVVGEFKQILKASAELAAVDRGLAGCASDGKLCRVAPEPCVEDAFELPLNGCDREARFGVPDANCAVPAGGGDEPAVAAESGA